MRERKFKAWEVSEANGDQVLLFLDKTKIEQCTIIPGEVREITIGLNESELNEIETNGFLRV